MRTRGAFVLGVILGAAVVWLWEREVEEYVQERTRAVRMKAAEGVRAVSETLRAGQEAIRPAPAARNA